ncbi:MAG: hypothetical protein JST68_26165 [Bacteroidetes bacterium]|nr:hypothetical protein [Bacteroidota bacterium]
MKQLLTLLILSCLVYPTLGQDSIPIRIHPSYGKANGIHRTLLGKNYRQEWSMEVRLPVLHVSQYKGGLRPEKLGGGMESKSLRMADAEGREWVIRTVEKVPDLAVPERLRETFAVDLVDDATSAMNPFAALLVPPVADAVGVAHNNPIIFYVAPDKALGEYEKTFAGKVVLLEERSPFKKSDNSQEMIQKLQADNHNSYDAVNFLKARMIDLLFADWDRHEDQWRWHSVKDGKGELFTPIPRDRDQVVSVTQGVLPTLVKDIYTMPRVPGFTPTIRKPRHYFFKSTFLNGHVASQFRHEDWSSIVNGWVAAVSDSVFEEALRRLPAPVYALRHDEFLRILKSRREGMAEAMEDYYRFINEIVDVRLTDGVEKVELQDTVGGVKLVIRRGDDDAVLVSKVYPSSETKQLRVYTMGGNDSVVIGRLSGAVKLRMIEGAGSKAVNVESGSRRLHLYNDTGFVPVNLYNLTFPLINAGLNSDDGFLLGGGFRWVRQKGFRQEPYSAMYQLMLTHSFSSDAFKLAYRSEWIRAVGSADVILQAQVNAPNNTINFFGVGNETFYPKKAGVKYYRARFGTYDLDPALRWKGKKYWSISVGPSLEYYTYDNNDNTGRLISQQGIVGSYDSLTLEEHKLHLGGAMNFTFDSRKDNLLPSSGVLVSVTVNGYKGMGDFARDYGRVEPLVGYDLSLNKAGTIVVSDRVGGIVSIGKPAFYQLAFLGGQGNLLGYRQYRFAGRNAFYNNFEARAKLADVSSYIFPGELGVVGFFDVGRVWKENDLSDVWHNGQGGGIYYAPARLAVIRLLAGHSVEGWYPYFSLGVRF